MYTLLSLTMYVEPVTLSLHDEWKNHLAACLIDYNILIIEEEIAKGLYINTIVIKCSTIFTHVTVEVLLYLWTCI